MTTKIRIEKADQYPVYTMVQVQEVNADGKWVNVGEPRMLRDAAQLLEEHIHQNKRLVVSELPLGNA